MTRNVRRKLVYKDLSTGKLIPKSEAHNRDPSTWVEEEFLVVIDHTDDTESFIEDDQPPLLTDRVDD